MDRGLQSLSNWKLKKSGICEFVALAWPNGLLHTSSVGCLTITRRTIMGLGERVEATAKDLEGKAQETSVRSPVEKKDMSLAWQKQVKTAPVFNMPVEDMK